MAQSSSRRALLGTALAAAGTVAGSAPALAAVSRTPDAELIAMCDELVALDIQFCELCDEDAELPAEEIERLHSLIVDRSNELEAEIATWTAETPEGLRALVQAARHTLSADARRGAIELVPDTEIAWAALDSALTMLDARRLA